MRTYNVMVTCMGGYGALNLAENIRRSSIGNQIKFFGSHADPYMLARSSAEINYLVPWAKDEEDYIEATKKFIRTQNIDLLIPKSDREVQVVSKYRDLIECAIFLPEHREIISAQDKYSFYRILKDALVRVAETYGINSFDDIDAGMKLLPKAKRYWIRVKTAGMAGAVAATWVETAEQAKRWIMLWQEMNGTKLSEFTISEFLPGRLFECLLLYNKGQFKVAKVYENLRYYGSDQRISGMSSTPEIAKSCSDQKAIDAIKESIKAVEAVAKSVGSQPNGVYHLSAKENKDGKPCITECNIGRTPSTCGFFDRIGKIITGELYVRYALDIPGPDPDGIYDIEKEEIYMIRSLDKELTLKTKKEIESYLPILEKA